MGVTRAQIEQFHEQGFLIVENVLTPDEVEVMRARAEEIARGELPENSRIRRQVEPAVERGEQAADDYEASLRKMAGLALAGDEVFAAHARRPRIVEIIQALMGPDLTLYQDQLFMKPPRVGSRQPYHQDQPAGFHIDPPEHLTTCWTALDESTEENGCLRYLPGSHKLGPLTKEQRASYEARALAGKLEGEVPLILPPGGAGFHHGWILHASNVNLSNRRRRGYATHYVRSDVRYTGPEPKRQFLRVSGQTFPGSISA
ncbi:MAG: phytanoyl-CoA dioxygenase family protein [Chloroflexi bacterium]|nr:phytanoyl-CoA dioxygenase family protein [Chloroflexota bacterium]